MDKLKVLKILLDNPDCDDELLEFYLLNAQNIICNIRNTETVETQFETIQIKIAVELFNKRGAEGQTSHQENGISRGYETADVSASLLSQIPSMVTTPFGTASKV